MKKALKKIGRLLITGAISGVFFAMAMQKPHTNLDQKSILRNQIDSGIKDTILPYPFKDNTENVHQPNTQSDLYLKNPSNISTEVEYDPRRREFVVKNRAGSLDYRTPQTLGFEEYLNYDFDKSMNEYWQQRIRTDNIGKQGGWQPKLRIPGEAFDKIFGSNTIEIKPQGSAELIFGANISKVQNPNLSQKLQKTVNFDFDTKIQLGVNGSIGDKLKLGINFNTEATFDFENKTKIGYTGKEDEIVKSIEAGNVSLPLNGTLITGSQSLFGFKTELQFGRLTVTSIFSQQKSESETMELQGGAQISKFKLSADKYESNRHFFLSYYFRDNYESALAELPIIKSGVTITKVEVWITNKTNDYDNARNIVGFTDLSEGLKPPYNDPNNNNIYSDAFIKPNNLIYPSNQTNSLYRTLLDDYEGIRDIGKVSSILDQLAGEPYNFRLGRDYEKIENARKLDANEYTVNNQLGYISLNSALNSDEILAVAYEYTMNGETYRVGEFSNGIPAPKTLVAKLIKGTNLSPRSPVWDLMMKNIYAVGAYQINAEDFTLEVLYNDVFTGNYLNYLPNGAAKNKILLNAMNLDNLNTQLDPQPDGRFDFIQGITILPEKGRVIFPVLEPFGEYIYRITTGKDPVSEENKEFAKRISFTELYDSTLVKAKLSAEKNKFMIRGTYKSSTGSQIQLNAMNIPKGSVKVVAGGRSLEEGIDYTVDYDLGRVSILDDALLESGTPIKVSLENQAMYAVGTRTLLGSHLNYKFNDNFNVGGTVLHLHERPLTHKVSFGDEPISNTIWGFDAAFSHEVPLLTKWIDRLPLIETKEPSTITFEGEFAQLIPGSSRFIDKKGTSYIDDFDNEAIEENLIQPSSWYISSVPSGNFNEGLLVNQMASGYNRAKLSWYVINPDLVRGSTYTPDHLRSDADQRSDPYVREIYETDLFPKRQSETGQEMPAPILNIAFYPNEKGPYNYETNPTQYSAGINSQGLLNSPETRWGGIMRRNYSPDFELRNISYVEFWLLDPFINNPDHSGGDVYFELGDISEDILKDSKKTFENGLSDDEEKELSTNFGKIPKTNELVQTFDNIPESRAYQDVGLDGLSDAEELSFFRPYIDQLRQISNTAYLKALDDPSNDNFHFYKGSDYDDDKVPILQRYKLYNGLEGDVPVSGNGESEVLGVHGNFPDKEDINQDRRLDEAERFFQYKISISPTTMGIGLNPYIQDMIVDVGKRKNNKIDTVKWYLFRIPVTEPYKTVGDIEDFKSIRFLRTFLTNFKDSIIMRMAEFRMVGQTWRTYPFDMSQGRETTTDPQPEINTGFELSVINLEENGSREPIRYILPPDVDRIIDPMNPQMRMLNEQALVLKVNRLEDGDARAIYKELFMDFRQYKKLQLWLHTEGKLENDLKDGDLKAFVRIGTDMKENYYEYEIPLKVTPWGNYRDENDADKEKVWPNRIDMPLELLTYAKQQRNNAMLNGSGLVSMTSPYIYQQGDAKIKVLGNPNLGDVQNIMIGVRNPSQGRNTVNDDGLGKSAELWVNELRLADFKDKGGWAANGRLTTKLADFGTLTLSGNTSTPGFGSIEQKVNERQKEQIIQYDITSNFEMGKLFNKKYGVKLPMYLSYSRGIINPEYNPLDPDIPFKTALTNPEISKKDKEDLKNRSQDFTERKSINFTNIKIDPIKEEKKLVGNPNDQNNANGEQRNNPNNNNQQQKINTQRNNPFDISNWSATYAYNEINKHNITTTFDNSLEHYVALNYTFSARPKNYTPFAKSKTFNNKSLRLIKDINFYLLPQMISLRTDVNRKYREVMLRDLSGADIQLPLNVEHNIIWSRQYDLKYNLTKDLKLDFQANNMSRVDAPYGAYDKDSSSFRAKRDSLWDNYKSFGRTTQYNHKVDLNWTLPINKLPLLDWLNSTARYSANYFWDAAPKAALEMGNTIKNSNTISLNGTANITTLYNKIGYMKKLEQRMKGKQQKKFEDVKFETKEGDLKAGKPKKINHNLKTMQGVAVKVTDEKGAAVQGTTEVEDENTVSFTPSQDATNCSIVVSGKKEKKPSILQKIVDHTVYAIIGVKNISVTYTENGGTILPGYMRNSGILGQDWTGSPFTPGLPFSLGWQDMELGEKHSYVTDRWLSTDSLLNMPFTINKTKTLNIRATIQPFPDMRIELKANKNESFSFSEFYIYEGGDKLVAKSPKYTGTYSISYFMIPTTLWKTNEKSFSNKAYENFMTNRLILGWRIANQRQNAGYRPDDPNIDPATNLPRNDGYPNGYGATSQDVLITSFLAAYAGKSAKDANLNTFPKIPMPNWSIKYDGLGKLPFFEKYFKTVSIGHAYTCDYRVGGYMSNSDFDFESSSFDGFSYSKDSVNYYFIPQNDISMVSLSEKFNPLIDFDFLWKNSLSTVFELNRSRELAMSLNNSQIMETSEFQYVFGLGYRIKDLAFNLTVGGNQKAFKSDLNLRVDVSIRNRYTIIRKIEENVDQFSAGETSTSIKFAADYALTEKFNIRFFYDQVINKPKTSISFPTSNTKVGISLRFTLIP